MNYNSKSFGGGYLRGPFFFAQGMLDSQMAKGGKHIRPPSRQNDYVRGENATRINKKMHSIPLKGDVVVM